jgi:hypothetical protein
MATLDRREADQGEEWLGHARGPTLTPDCVRRCWPDGRGSAQHMREHGCLAG